MREKPAPALRFWNDSVLPGNVVNQRLTLARNPHYGYHVFALGANGSIWHKFQTGPETTGDFGQPLVPMSAWHCLTPNASLVFANDPAVAPNADGHLELFVAFKPDSLDLWQMYQTDATNPLAWSSPRGPQCACEDPDPSKCPWCETCEQDPECSKHYWCNGFPFTTSDVELYLDPKDSKLKLHYRSFDGHFYQMQQSEPNKSDKWKMGNTDLGQFE